MNSEQALPAVKKGRIIDFSITKAAFEGKGLGKVGEFAIFVKHTAPGDLIRARIIRKKKKFAEGILLELLEPSSLRVEPLCRHAGVCGGCNWQHISYEQELLFKQEHVQDHFRRIGGFEDLVAEEALGAPEPYYYRNKMEYSFGDRRWLTGEEITSEREIENKDFALGLHVPGRYDRILNLEECHLQIPVSFEIMDALRSYALEHHIPPYNTHKHEGFLRNVIIRTTVHTDDLMVNLVTASESPEIIDPLFGWLKKTFPGITTAIHTVNATRSPSSDGHPFTVRWGPGFIEE
ncbi:TRAM domain-containing protein, partial [Balneolaceae bacterium ANBcel3]|nr:TRAM domain-containing protein [Balneolaceae bacterium ANBcel3]